MPDRVLQVIVVEIPKELHLRSTMDTGVSIKYPPDEGGAGAVTPTNEDRLITARHDYALMQNWRHTRRSHLQDHDLP